jgi:hypothetical protein
MQKITKSKINGLFSGNKVTGIDSNGRYGVSARDGVVVSGIEVKSLLDKVYHSELDLEPLEDAKTLEVNPTHIRRAADFTDAAGNPENLSYVAISKTGVAATNRYVVFCTSKDDNFEFFIPRKVAKIISDDAVFTYNNNHLQIEQGDTIIRLGRRVDFGYPQLTRLFANSNNLIPVPFRLKAYKDAIKGLKVEYMVFNENAVTEFYDKLHNKVYETTAVMYPPFRIKVYKESFIPTCDDIKVTAPNKPIWFNEYSMGTVVMEAS